MGVGMGGVGVDCTLKGVRRAESGEGRGCGRWGVGSGGKGVCGEVFR